MASNEQPPVDYPSTRLEQSIGPGLRVTWIGMVVNLLLIIIKLWAGFVTRSQALIADGVHSVSDLFTDVVVILGLKWGRKLEDENHLYGHGRIETLSSMVVGLSLILIAIGIAYSAINSIFHREASIPSLLSIGAAFISIVAKEAMYWYTIRVGRQIKSAVLIGNAWHHRTDAMSSVAVLIGVVAVYVNPDWYLADSCAALVVTLLIVKVGGDLTWSAVKELSDTAPDSELLEQLTKAAKMVEGVRQVHDMRARHSGPQVFVELHVVVDPSLTVREGHAIAREAKRRLLGAFPDVTRVIIHVDPEPKDVE